MSDVLHLPVLPIRDSVLFPGIVQPVVVGRPQTVAAVEAALGAEDKTLVVVAQRDGSVEQATSEDLHRCGTRSVIRRMARQPSGAVEMILQGVERVCIQSIEQSVPYLRAICTEWPMPEEEATAEVEAMTRQISELALRAVALTGHEPAPLQSILEQITEPLQLAWTLAHMFSLESGEEQKVLEASSRLDALQMVNAHLAHEVQVLELRARIAEQARTEMTKEQREYLLRQQLRAIEQELGESDADRAETHALRERMDSAQLPPDVKKEVERELRRLERLPRAAADFQVSRGWLELVLELPWHEMTTDQLDLQHAREVLDEDHFGLTEVKERILEHLAVMKLNPEARAAILIFVGPPGVGKTSLGRSIARAMGRKFERTSLGGVHDEAELRGHRRTYIGAMPGRIISCIRRVGVKNPVLMLDEVDKLGEGFHGDPYAALMEILDPAQNESFRDNYIDLPFDLSHVFFIGTANSLDAIPRPLLDRMEVLTLSGYTHEEKRQIAHRYLIPRLLRENGLNSDLLQIPDDTLSTIISRYTREAGVRMLERSIGRLSRKIALRLELGGLTRSTATPAELPDLLGPERFEAEHARTEEVPGVAAGLAWTEAGGDVLYVEALLLPTREGLLLTGQLGDVMKESAQAALSCVLSRAASLGIRSRRIRRYGAHVHVPAGAVPKDGPSAGIAMATALASAYSRIPTRHDTAMTGEITLTGLVLPVGGIKEKVLAAHRGGLRRVILPRHNESDLRDVPGEVRADITFILVERLDEVLREALVRQPDTRAVRPKTAPDAKEIAEPTDTRGTAQSESEPVNAVRVTASKLQTDRLERFANP